MESQHNHPKVIHCPRCRNINQFAVNFCSQCGYSFAKAQLPSIPRTKHLLGVVVFSLLLFLFGWNTQRSLAGIKPTSKFSGDVPTNHQTFSNDPIIKEMRQSAQANPGEINGWRSLAGVLLEKVRNSEPPVDPTLVFESIDALRKILDLDPKDSLALIAMADLSFEQQAFQKAIQFYEQYLTIESEDLNARARYASALTFIGKAEDALNELGKITNKDPKHFQASAYGAIALAQLGRFDEARKQGKEALKLAPSEEARARFSDFLVRIDQVESQKNSSPGTKSAGKSESINQALPPDASAIIESIKNNPVAGAKFSTGFTKGEDTLVLQFNDFPMDKMPPFAKDKFINGLKKSVEGIKNRKISILRFEDATTRNELYSLKF